MLFKDHDKSDVVSAVEEAISARVSSSEAVEHILINRITPEDKDLFVRLNNWETFPVPDVSAYNRIGGAL